MPVMANFLLVHEAIGWWADCVNCRPFPLIYDVSIFVFRYLYFFNPCFSFSNNNFGNVVHRKHKVSLNMFLYFCQWSNWMIGKVCQVQTIFSDLWCLSFPPRILFTNQPKIKTFDFQLSRILQYLRCSESLGHLTSMGKISFLDFEATVFNSGSQNELRCVHCMLEQFKSAGLEEKFNDWVWNVLLEKALVFS